jgi:predicted ArsR family transcriptional regulator
MPVTDEVVSVSADDFAARVAGVGALAEPVRRDLYLYVVAQHEPVSRDQAAAGVAVARHTAKFHLDRLVEEGLLETDFRRLSGRTGPGAGRPAKLYKRSAREVSVSIPERHYDLAGQLMAQAIDEAVRCGTPVLEDLRRAAVDHGSDLGRCALAEAGGEQADDDAVVSAACRVLAAHGFEPRTGDSMITLANCPFHALAREHTDLVCGMNLALVTALIESLRPNLLEASLDPAPGRCCVVLARS